LDVTTERFRLDTQFFGGYDAKYNHNGSLKSDQLIVGADPTLQAQRKFANAGELLVGFANSFVVEFGSNGTNFISSLANFSFIQPLLRGAGRDIALEQLTFVERALLANLRAYNQYRQGFYTQVAIGELGLPDRSGAAAVRSSLDFPVRVASAVISACCNSSSESAIPRTTSAFKSGLWRVS
jgi:hypothetical protein